MTSTRSTPASTDRSPRTVLVTGAASGIGLACATRFAADGDEVHLLDRDPEAVEKAAAEVGGVPHAVDLGELAVLADLVPEADVVVNNAGFQHVEPAGTFDPGVLRRMLAVMVEAPLLLAQRSLPRMRRRGWGRFVHVTSVHGHRASAYKLGYVTAKHALEGMSKVLAVEGAPDGITSNTVAPGYVRTPLVESQIADQARTHGIDEDAVVEQILLARSPVKRLIETEEVASLVAFLCGPGTASITGASYEMSGGWTAA